MTVRTIEATIGAFFAFLTGFLLLLCGFAIAQPDSDPSIRTVRVMWGAMVVAEGFFLYKLKGSLEAGIYPFAPQFALRMGKMPLALRPLAAVWWIAHVALGVAGCALLEYVFFLKAPAGHAMLHRCLFLVIVDFTIAYSTNLYALLAVTALGGGERIVDRLWRMRIVADISLAAIATTLPVFFR